MPRCKLCSETRDVNVYCPECADRMEYSHIVQAREDYLTARIRSLGWTVAWFGVREERWASLHRVTEKGFCGVTVSLQGNVLSLNSTHAQVQELATWFEDLTAAWR